MIAVANEPKECKAHHHSVQLMGCHFVISAVDRSPDKAWNGIRTGVAEMERIERLISSWMETSETSEINRQAGRKPVKVSLELWELIDRSLRVSKLTSGAFDISGSLSRDYWNFDKGHHTAPSEDKIEELRNLIDYRYIHLNRSDRTVFLEREGMKIGFGGIGKGYAAYRAHKVMLEAGVESGLINASGDLMAWGQPPNKNHWTINIPNPEVRDNSILKVNIPSGSVVTSGSYEKYTIVDNKKYGHIVDPRTGRPVNRLKSVTVMSPNPEFADALATAITVMGSEEGLAIVNQLEGVECFLIDDNDVKYYSNSLL